MGNICSSTQKIKEDRNTNTVKVEVKENVENKDEENKENVNEFQDNDIHGNEDLPREKSSKKK